ncbi:hypothetical protein GH733_000492 [Mirounga leonina]|nr:hypothetical protein GH733_000492 [Mirounga leonina]
MASCTHLSLHRLHAGLHVCLAGGAPHGPTKKDAVPRLQPGPLGERTAHPAQVSHSRRKRPVAPTVFQLQVWKNQPSNFQAPRNGGHAQPGEQPASGAKALGSDGNNLEEKTLELFLVSSNSCPRTLSPAGAHQAEVSRWLSLSPLLAMDARPGGSPTVTTPSLPAEGGCALHATQRCLSASFEHALR